MIATSLHAISPSSPATPRSQSPPLAPLAPKAGSRHSEPAGGGRSEVRFSIARLPCDESLFHFFVSLRRSLCSLCSYLCDLCVTVPLLLARHSPLATRHCSVVIPSGARDLLFPNR